jgi:hypothetical protein
MIVSSALSRGFPVRAGHSPLNRPDNLSYWHGNPDRKLASRNPLDTSPEGQKFIKLQTDTFTTRRFIIICGDAKRAGGGRL